MGYALLAIVAALAVSISVYGATSSVILAFLGYSAGGTMTLLLALAAAALAPDRLDADAD